MTGIPLVVNVKANGALIATTAIRAFERAVAAAEARAKAHEERTKLGTAALLKMWAAYHMVTSASAVASAVASGFTAALGYLIDTVLIPILPYLIEIETRLYSFTTWASTHAPGLIQALIMVGGALLLAFGGPGAMALGAVLIMLGFLSAWGDQNAARLAALILIIAAAVIGLGVAFGFLTAAAWPWIAAGLAVLSVILALRAAWLALTGQSFSWPSIEGIKSSLGLGGGGAPMPVSGPIGFPAGPTIINDNSIGGITYNGQGTSAGGRDAAIALRADLGMSRRAAF